MRRTIIIGFIVFVILSLVACSGGGVDIPSVGEDGTVITDATEIPDGEDEASLHRKMGIDIIKSMSGDFDVFGYYGLDKFEGCQQALTDSVYRAKLDIDIIRNRGFVCDAYDKLYEAVNEYLDGKAIKALHPQSFGKNPEAPLSLGWRQYISQMLAIDGERFAADDTLVDLYRSLELFYQQYHGAAAANVEKYLDGHPLLLYKILPQDATVAFQGLDETNYLTRVILKAPDNCKVIVKFSDSIIFYDTYSNGLLSWDTYLFDSGEAVYLLPTFEGIISIATVDESGMIGRTVSVMIESNADKLPVKQVELRSSSFEKALRAHLGIDASKKIYTTDLLHIRYLFVNGNIIVFDDDSVTPEMQNAVVSADAVDFSFDDLEYFYSLDEIVFLGLPHKGLPNGRYLFADSITIMKSSVRDISVLSNSLVKNLYLMRNDIVDANALKDAKYLQYLSLHGNASLKAVKLPPHRMASVIISNTAVDSLEFLEAGSDPVLLNISGTEITDFSALLKLRSLKTLHLPEGADRNIAELLPSLTKLYIGKEEIELEK